MYLNKWHFKKSTLFFLTITRNLNVGTILAAAKFLQKHCSLRQGSILRSLRDLRSKPTRRNPALSPTVRVVTKISSCRVNTTSRRGIKRLEISFGSIFLLFSNQSSRGPLSQQPGKIPGPRLLMTTLNSTSSRRVRFFSSSCFLQIINLHLTFCHFFFFYFTCTATNA